MTVKVDVLNTLYIFTILVSHHAREYFTTSGVCYFTALAKDPLNIFLIPNFMLENTSP
jgi:hypothetical protein